MAGLEVRGLEKAYGGVSAVRGVSLRAEDGEFLVLVGPSGCGKSTLLRLIAGLEVPDAGEVRIAGRIVDHLDPAARDVAMVFQSYALYPHLTVERNIGFPLKMARRPRNEIRKRVAEAAATLGIGELLPRKPRQLSGGQQQRVALARALVRRPRLFLLDEPLSNVDARLRGEMRAELQRLHRATGITMIYVTHDQVEAMTLGTRIALLRDGELQQIGPPLALYHQPANRFVASFLGSPPMNLLEGPAARALLPEPDCVVGFRPHDAHLGGPLEARLDFVEELGKETRIHAFVDRQEIVVTLPPETAVGLHPGSTLAIGVAPEALFRFDPRSGNRLP